MITKAIEQKSGEKIQVTYDNGSTATVPKSGGNIEYRELMEWVAKGNSIAPYVAPTPPPKTQFTSGEYLDRFTEVEYDAVLDLIEVSKPVRKYYDRLLASSYIDLEDPKTAQGLSALVQAGVITAARKDELLTPESAE